MLFVAALLIGFAHGSGLEIGTPVPGLVTPLIGGGEFNLSAQKNVTVIHYWATWCGLCRKEIPELNRIYSQYHARGLNMIGLSADRPHDRSEVLKAKADIQFPIAMLTDVKSNGFVTPASLPVTYVIDRKGVLRRIFSMDVDGHELSGKDLSAAVLPLLSAQ